MNNVIKLKKVGISALLLSFVLIYTYTFQLWIEFFGINNIARYFVYIVFMVCTCVVLLSGAFIKKATRVSALIAIYFVCIVINVISSKYMSSFLDLYDYVFVVFAYMGGIYFFKQKSNAYNFKKMILFLGTITSLLAIFEFATDTLLLNSCSTHMLSFAGALRVRPNSLFGSPIICGLMAAIVCVCTVSSSLTKRKRIILLVINLLAVLCSLSRGPIISVIAGIVCVSFIKSKNLSKKFKIVFLIVVIATILFALISNSSLVSNNVVFYRISQIFDWSNEGGNKIRLSVWEKVFEYVENPLIGNGIGSLNKLNFGVTESGILSVYFEIGLIGLVLYYAPYLVILFNAIKRCKMSDSFTKEALFAVGIIITILIDNIFLQVLQSLIIQILFGLACAKTTCILREDNA